MNQRGTDNTSENNLSLFDVGPFVADVVDGDDDTKVSHSYIEKQTNIHVWIGFNSRDSY